MRKIIDLIGLAEASRILGISPQLLHSRARRGKIRAARQRPTLGFRLADVLDYQRTMPATLPVGGRPKGRALRTIIMEILR